MMTRISTILVAGLLAACSDQTPGSSGEGPIEKAGKAVDRTAQAAVRETGNAVLHSKVRLALLDALGTDALRMQIDVDDGNVSLAGKVREPNSRDRAAEVARKVTGVKGVKTDLGLVMEGSDDVVPVDELSRELADQKLEAKLRLKLLEEIGSSALKVSIRSVDGTVTLSGDLADRDLRSKAETMVKGTDGVSRVINDIRSESK